MSVAHVAVVGRDVPLWLTAAALRRALAPAGIAVTAVALPSEATPADICPTLPAIEALHNQIGIDEAALLRGVRGAFTLGQYFTDASGAGQAPFLHSYGAHGTGINGTDFFPHWVKARRNGLGVGLDDFSLTATAALHGRLFLPDQDSEKYGRADYGYHLPAAAYARSLMAIARHLGVEAVEADAVGMEREEGTVRALRLDGDRRIEADLFVDATPDGLLLRALPGVAFEPSAAPGDRMLSALAPRPAALPVHSEVRAGAEGWTAMFPAMTQIHVAHVWSSDAVSDDEALEAARAASGSPLDAVTIRSFAPGVASDLWADNVVGVGEASCVLDPAHGLALHMLQLGIVHLVANFPAEGDRHSARRAEYNRAMRSHIARLADFQTAHYRLQRYAGSFWDAARELPAADMLDHLVDIFRLRGELAPFEDESLPPDSWRALLLGHGIMPEGWRPSIDRVPPDEVKTHFRKMLGFVREAVLRQPTHDAYLARIAQRTHG